MKKIRVFLVDDHGLVRAGLRCLIEKEDDMEVVGEAQAGDEALAKIKEQRPDVVLMDLSLPCMPGAEVTRRLKGDAPEVRVIAVTLHEDVSHVRELIEAGALGFVHKRAAEQELFKAIRTVSAGEIFVDPRMTGKLISRFVQGETTSENGAGRLSERENEVLRHVATGHSNKEIAALLGVSPKTVETYKARSMDKLHLKTRVDVVRYARERFWAGQPRP